MTAAATLAATQAANLAETVRQVRARLKLPYPGPIPRDRLGEYMRTLSTEILINPGSYTATAVANARRYLEAPDAAPLETFGIGDAVTVFSTEFAAQAATVGNAAADVGRGVVNTARLVPWLLPLAVVTALGLFLFRRVK